MDIARINFSHGSDEDHTKAFEEVRRASKEAGRPIGLLADLPGPKIRLGEIIGGEMSIEAGSLFELGPPEAPPNVSGASTDHPQLASDLQPGDRILLADGAAELRVVKCNGAVTTEVVTGGTIRSRAGVNVPSHRLSLPAITNKDEVDLRRAMELGADFIAQSFVRRAEDVRGLRGLIGSRPTQIVAKIETGLAVEAADDILEEADAIMLARGDLGAEIPFEEIPVIQKSILRRATGAGRAGVVATQMLESMINSPRPTRAEASDVANAVLDGADAILLSAETAIGKYPVEAVRAASRICSAAESKGGEFVWERRQPQPESDAEAIAQAAAMITHRAPDVAAIACWTQSGRTAALVSSVRPRVPIHAFSPEPDTVTRLTIRRGVFPVHCEDAKDTDSMIARMDELLKESSLVPPGAVVLMVASNPVGQTATNLLKVHRITR
jgi:pyruvate kinase